MPETIGVMGNRQTVAEPGQLASEIIAHINSTREGLEAVPFTEPEGEMDMLVYSRVSSYSFPAAMEYAQQNEVPLLFLSTKFNPEIPSDLRSAVINAPNVSLEVLTYLDRIEALADILDGWDITITEHHQESKADVSGTAKKLADMLGVSHDVIKSVRNFETTQDEFDLPDSAKDGYAVHRVEFTEPGTGTVMQPSDIVMIGRESYAKGVLSVFDALDDPEVRNALKGSHISIVDFYRDVIRVRRSD